MEKVSVYFTHWETHKNQLKQIRETVFIEEQSVPIKLEWDGLDEKAIHVMAVIQSEEGLLEEKLAVGTARIIIEGNQAYIGRMAVLPQWRRQGLGTQILQSCINECKKSKVKQITLNAQSYITDFYQKAGFKIIGKQFFDAGIPHQRMIL